MRMFVLVALVAILALTVHSDGMIMPREPEEPYPLILNHYVDITIDDTYGSFSVDQEFVNNGPRDIQGVYMFPLPFGSIKNFQMVVDGRVIEGKLLDKDEARDLYHRYVLERKEVSLLEYVGKDMFTASVLLKRGEKVRIQISYDQVIEQSSGIYSVFYPLSTERYTTKPIDPVDIKLRIKAAGDIGFVLSPTHDIETTRVSQKEIVVTYYSKEIPDRDFQVFYGVTERDYDVKVLSNKNGEEDGYFMLFVYPSNQDMDVVEKDVVYAIDVSGSMSGIKIEQAKRALKYGLGQLGEGDRFSIITFSSNTETYKEGLVGSSQVSDAKDFVDGLEAMGATNIEDPLVLASGVFRDDGRMHIVVLLTD
ncbi:MAG: VIT domain-containing protein, partial [Candidatus Micrarchaeota archaeon]